MDILAALKQEEAKFEKLLDNARQKLDTVQTAIKLFAGIGGRGKTSSKTKGKKNVMSAATKAKIAKAAKRRWAKIKAEKKGKV
jgi:hypothetical protein